MLDVTPVEATVAHTLLSVLAIQLGRCPRYNQRVMSPFFILAFVFPLCDFSLFVLREVSPAHFAEAQHRSENVRLHLVLPDSMRE